jgi:uncharacterized membrane protein
VLGALVTGQERAFRQDPLFAFRLLADIGLRALSPAVNDPATAVQVLDTMESLLRPLVSRDLDVAGVAGSGGVIRVVLALPSWDDYLRTGLLDVAPPSRQPPVTRRLDPSEELGAGNFPLLWHDATGVETG